MGSVLSNGVLSLRSGAQCLVMRCSEPAMNTPGAQRRLDAFMHPLLVGAGVQIDKGTKGSDRWLKDRVQRPGVVRRYAENHQGRYQEEVEEDIGLLINVHTPEVVFLVEHTNCGERQAWHQETFGTPLSAENEPRLIARSLNSAAALIKRWHDRRGNGRLFIFRTVGLVSSAVHACERRFSDILLLDDYLRAHCSAPVSEDALVL